MLNLSNYTLTFDDEFNSLSLANGSGGTWTAGNWWSPDGSTDSTLTSFTVNPAYGPTSAADANVYSTNSGVLSIGFEPTPSDVSPAAVSNRSFISGELTTHSSFAQTYGYFEANMKVPNAAGLNSAFWLLPEDGSAAPVELDAAEILGNDPTTLVETSHSGISGTDPMWSDIPDASQ